MNTSGHNLDPDTRPPLTPPARRADARPRRVLAEVATARERPVKLGATARLLAALLAMKNNTIAAAAIKAAKEKA